MPKKSKKSNKKRKLKPSADSNHKSEQGKRLNNVVRAASAEERQYEKKLKSIEAAAEKDPVGTFLQLEEFTDRQRRLYMRYARLRFGAEVHATEGNAQALVTEIVEDELRLVGRGTYKPIASLSVVRPECWPRNLGEHALLLNLLASYAVADFAQRAMIQVGYDVHEAGYNVDDMNWVMCQVFVHIYRNRFVFLGIFMEQESGLPSGLREEATGRLAGWVASKISLNTNHRLYYPLAEQGQKPFDALLGELPAATLVEWEAARREGLLKDFKNLVIHSVEELGREALIRSGKVLDTSFVDVGGASASNITAGEDEDLEEFELRETLRQQLDQLPYWIEKAKFSERQRQVYELDMQTNYDTEAIARELDIDPDTVRQHRMRYTDKLRTATGL